MAPGDRQSDVSEDRDDGRDQGRDDGRDPEASLRPVDGVTVRCWELLRYLPDAAMMVSTTSWRVLRANDRAADLFQCPVDELAGQPVEAFVLGLAEVAHTASTEGVTATTPARLSARRRDGVAFLAEVSIASAPVESTGRPPGGPPSAIDTRAGAALLVVIREFTFRNPRDEYFSLLVDVAPDAVVVVDQDGTITLVNTRAEWMFGYRADELVGSPVELLVPGSVRDRHTRLREAHTADPAVGQMGTGIEVRARRKNGSEFPVEITLTPRRIEGRRVTAALIRDITGRKNAERDWQRARDEALEASRLKSRFITTVSHEIRTPMNGVIGLTDLLLGTELNPTQRRYVDGLRASGEALLSVINDVLDLSKIEAGDWCWTTSTTTSRSCWTRSSPSPGRAPRPRGCGWGLSAIPACPAPSAGILAGCGRSC